MSNELKEIMLNMLRREKTETDEETTALVRKQMAEDMKTKGCTSWDGAYAKVMMRGKSNE